MGVGDLVRAVVVGTEGVDLVASAGRPGDGSRAGVARADAAAPPVERLEHRQRAHRAPAAPGAGLRLAAARRRRRHPAGGCSRPWPSRSPSLTDRVDGELARRRGLVTDFGKIADPIADKALIGTALVGLSLLGELPWWVTVVVLVREIGITLLRFVVIRHGVMPAGRGGKAKTRSRRWPSTLYLLPLPVRPGSRSPRWSWLSPSCSPSSPGWTTWSRPGG